VPDEHRGKVLRCGSCQKPFRTPPLPAPPPPEEPVEVLPLEGEPPTPVTPLRESLTSDPDKAPRPLPARRRDYDDEEDAPAPRRNRGPGSKAKVAEAAPRKRLSTGMLVGIIGGAAAAVLVLVAVGIYAIVSLGSRPLPDVLAPAGNPDDAAAEQPPPVNIQPAPLKDARATLTLPGSVRDVCVGGGGRFLICHLPQQRQLAIFDVNQAKVAKYLPVAEDQVFIAAGMDKLLVVMPDKNLVQRWSLTTFEREVTAPLPIQAKIHSAVMGSASDGPLVVGGPAMRDGFGLPLRFLDVKSLKEIDFKMGEGRGGGMVGTHPQYPHVMRISPDGRVIGMWNIGLSPSGLQSAVREGDTLKVYYEHESVGHIIPGPDNRTLYTGDGLYTEELKKIGNDRGTAVFPAVQGNLYVSLIGGGNPFDPGGGDRRMAVAVHLAGDARPLVTLKDLAGLEMAADPFGRQRESLPLDKRLFLIPQGKLVVTIPDTGDKLYLQRFDLDEALEKAGIDYLLVTSQPPRRFQPGRRLVYQMAVKSKKGGVKYKLESGPQGMTVSPAGLVTWSVPSDNAAREENVIVTVSDASGQEIFHTFRLGSTANNRDDQAKKPADPPGVAQVKPPADDLPILPFVQPPDKDPGPKPPDFFPMKEPEPKKEPKKEAPPVWAVTKIVEIKPAPLKEDKTTLKLPGSVRDVCVGGGGRFLILHLPQQRQLAIFDVNEAKIAKYLPVADDNIRFAAGMDKLLVALPDKNIIQRWDLTSFERELTAPLPVQGTVQVLLMGHASAGPLYVGMGGGDGIPGNDGPRFAGNGSLFLNPATLKEVGYKAEPFHGMRPEGARASADGTVVAGPSDWQGSVSALFRGAGIAMYHTDQASGARPMPDGRTIASNNGLFTPELKPLGVKVAGELIPALQGGAYLAVSGGEVNVFRQDGNKMKVSVHLIGDGRPLLTLSDMEDLTPAGAPWEVGNRGTLPLDKRVFLIPQGQLLVTIPATGDKLHLRRFDLDKALDESGIDYLVVTSQPPQGYAPGAKFSYQMVVKSKKGGVKYKLESGPDGMKVSPAGLVSWDVPANVGGEADVIVTVGDATGQEVFHTFKLSRGAPGAPAPKDAPPPAKDPPPKRPEPEQAVEVKPLPPAPPVGGIKPAPLKADREERDLPSAVAGLCVGGGGRFLILHLPKERKLAVFDANEAKVVRYLPAAEDNLQFAAGMDKLIVALPSSNVLQRWSLSTFEREATVPIPVKGAVQALAMGSASRGPLVVSTGGGDRFGGGAELALIDPQTFKESNLKFGGDAGLPLGLNGRGSSPRVSADGTVIVGAEGGWVLEGKTYKSQPLPAGSLPGPDDRTLYTAGRLYTAEGKPLGEQVGGHGQMVWYLPAVQGPFYFSLNQVKKEGRAGRDTLRFSVHLPGEKRPLVSLPYLYSLDTLTDWTHGVPPFDRHVFLIPDARLLVILPGDNERLVLHRFDLDELLAKADTDFLFVQSQPVTVAVKGQPYVYPLVVRSKKGGVKIKVDGGPKGLKVTPEGKLTWDVPKDFAEAEVDVILTVGDASGQEVFHTFKVAVKDKGEAPAPPLPAPKEPEAKRPEPEQVVEVKPQQQPAPPVAGIKPAPLKADREERPLPSPADDACFGGGGRFFILHLPKERQLAVFDVNEAKVVKYLPLADDHVKFAAGLDKLFVVSPDKNVIQRFSLSTFEKEVTVPLPIKGTVKAIATGAAASGPLLVHYASGGDRGDAPVTFIDPVTFKELELGGKGGGARHGANDTYHYRASPDGTVFGGWVTSHSQSMSSIVLGGKTARVYHGEMAGIVVPAADNTLVAGGGLYTPECKQLGSDKAEPRYRLRVPAQTGRFYVTCPGGGGAQFNTGELDTSKPVTVYLIGDARPIATLKDVELPASNEAWTRSDFTQDRRVLFVPEAKLIAILPMSNDRLVLHRLDLDEALEKAGVDYLFVTSRPPAAAYRGTQFSYTPRVKSKKGGLKYKLESGPQGMKVTPDGSLTWSVPKDAAEGGVDVLLSIADRAGQEIFHAFRLAVKNADEAPPPPVEEKEPPRPADPPRPVEPPPEKKPDDPPPPKKPVEAPPAGGERLSISAGPRTAPMVLALSPDGKALAVLTLTETDVRVYDTTSGKEKAVFRGVEKHPYCVAFSPDGTLLAAAGEDPVVRVWEVASGKEKAALRGQGGVVFTLAFAPDGKSVAAAGADRNIQLWDLDTQQSQTLAKAHASNILRIAFSADGKTLFSASLDGGLKLWDVAGKQERAALGAEGGLLTAALAPAGDLAATDSRDYRHDQTIRLWDLTTRKLAATLPGHGGRVEKMAFSPDGKLLASVGADQSLRLWDVGRRQEAASVKAHRGAVKYVTFSADGRTLATCGLDGVIKV
jgi:WD40 repeat protein